MKYLVCETTGPYSHVVGKANSMDEVWTLVFGLGEYHKYLQDYEKFLREYSVHIYEFDNDSVGLEELVAGTFWNPPSWVSENWTYDGPNSDAIAARIIGDSAPTMSLYSMSMFFTN